MKFTMNQFMIRMQAFDRQIVSGDELLKNVIEESGKVTFEGIIFNVPAMYDQEVKMNQEQLLLQLYDRQLVTNEQVREFLGYETTQEDA